MTRQQYDKLKASYQSDQKEPEKRTSSRQPQFNKMFKFNKRMQGVKK